MALLSVDSLTQNSTKLVRILVKTVELLLLSTGLFTTLVVVKRAGLLPYSCEIVFTSLLGFWTTVKCLLSSPLSICVFIHLMVLLIYASSAFHRRETDDDAAASGDHSVGEIAESLVVSPPPPAPPPPWSDENHQQLVLYRDGKSETEDPILLQMLEAREIEKTAESIGSDRSHRMGELLVRQDHSIEWKDVSVEYEEDDTMDATWQAITGGGKAKPKRKSLKKSETWDALHRTGELLVKQDHSVEWKDMLVEYEEDDTMDATRKAITGGGKGRPKKKSLKKSETWDAPPPLRRSAHVQRVDSEEVLPATSPRWKELRKAETFNDAVSINRRGGLRRDPSMSLEELNMQVEAFIKKFNDSMRLQRQESEKRFLDTINRGF